MPGQNSLSARVADAEWEDVPYARTTQKVRQNNKTTLAQRTPPPTDFIPDTSSEWQDVDFIPDSGSAMMPQEITLPDGRILVIPGNTTLDQRAALRNKLGASYADIKTGVGMEQRANQQAKQVLTGTGDQGNYDTTGRKVSGPKGEPLSYMEKAAQEQTDRQTTLGARINRASQSPTPFTNTSALYAPVPAARSIIGAKVGSEAGGAVAKRVSNSPEAEGYGELIGGAVGGVSAVGGPIRRAVGASKPLESVPNRTIGDVIESPSKFPAYLTRKAFPKPDPAAVTPAPSPVVGTSTARPVGNAALPPAPATSQAPMTLGQRTAAARTAAAPSTGVTRVPVPRAPMPGDPNLMGSVPREELPGMASRGVPGAANQQRLLGEPVVHTVPEGYPPPRSVTKLSERVPQPENPSLTQRVAGYKPSEKVTTMSEQPRNLGPEFEAQQQQGLIDRHRAILRNPDATLEEKTVAASRLREMGAIQ